MPTTVLTLREFLLREFPDQLSVSDQGANDWTTTGRIEGTEDMILDIQDPHSWSDDDLIAAFRRFAEAKGCGFRKVSSFFTLSRNGRYELLLWHTYREDYRGLSYFSRAGVG
jgi:hypothetical protein